MPVTTYNCTALTGGASRALDSHSRLVLNNGDRAIVALSTNKMLYFKYDSSATDAEDVATHPYKVRPDNYATAGVWVEQEADVAAASETKAGIMEIATNAEVDAETDNARAVSPAGLAHKLANLNDILPDTTASKSVGSTVYRWLKGWFTNADITNLDATVSTQDVVPKTTGLYSIGSAILKWLDGHFDQLTLGGVTRSTWPAAGSATVSMDDTYNNGSVVSVDNTDEVHKLTTAKHFKLTDSTGLVVYFDVDGDGNVISRLANDCENNVTDIQYPSGWTEDGTPSTSWKININGSEADLQTTGLTADRDFTFPDIDTMLAGSVLAAQDGFEIIAYP